MVFIVLCAVLLFSCEESSDQATTIQIDYTDRELLQIAEDARNTLPGFFRHLTRTGAEENTFCVKYPFETDNADSIGIEQVWLTGIHFKNGMYYGVLANSPRHLNNMEKGDKIMFDTGAITDWMYIRNGKIIGGYSIQYLLERIPEEQRSDNDWKLLEMFP